MKHSIAIMGFVALLGCLPFFSSCDKEDKENYYPLTVETADSLMGFVYGSGKYRQGDVIKVTAYPNPGYEFAEWQDGSTENPRMVDVQNVVNLTAYFRIYNEGVKAEHLPSVISKDLVLKDLGLKIDYVVDSSLVVENNALLTIEHGVTIEFSSESGYLLVEEGAALKMSGKADKQIILQGERNNANKGSWGYVEVRSERKENEMTYVTLNNCGSDSEGATLRLTANANIVMQNCTLAGGLGVGISSFTVEGNPFRNFTNNKISNMSNYAMHIALDQLNHLGAGNKYPNNKNFILVEGDTIASGAITFSSQGIPYLMSSDLIVAEDGIMSVEAGTTIAFMQNKKLQVLPAGTLQINGAFSSVVSLRGMQDGVAGYWQGVDFQSNRNAFGGNYINYCVINGGGSEPEGACLTLADEVLVELKGTQFFNSGCYGMKVRLNPETAKMDGVTSSGLKFANNKVGNVYDATTEQILPEMP